MSDQKSINYNLYTLASSLSKSATQFFVAHFGVGQPEMRVLSTLGSHAPLAAHQIVSFTAMDKALVSRVLAMLARRKYTRARQANLDVRRRLWELTPSGQGLVDRLKPIWKQREAVLQADLSPAEQRQLVDMLQRLYRASEALRTEETQHLAARKSAPKPRASARAPGSAPERTPGRARARPAVVQEC